MLHFHPLCIFLCHTARLSVTQVEMKEKEKLVEHCEKIPGFLKQALINWSVDFAVEFVFLF